MNETDLLSTFPRLYHLADGGAWPSIQARGLLSTSRLLDLYGISGAARIPFESARRSTTTVLTRPGYADVVLRDQTPMTDKALAACLVDDMTPREWYETLNRKVFFFTSRQKMQKLQNAKAGRDRAQLALIVDSRSLVSSYRDQILLSGMNTGATFRRALPRGPRSFLPISDFPYDARRLTRSPSDALVELTVADGVPDVLDHLIVVEEVVPGRTTAIWRRPQPHADVVESRP